jgi:peptidyl-prolyl cis-trans isomerase SurA
LRSIISLVSSVFILIGFALSATPSKAEVLLDRIVAIVDGYPVLYSEVMNKVKTGPLVVVSDYPADPKDPPFKRALQDAINFELVMQKARDLEIEVPESQVDSEIDSFLENRGQSKSGLMQFLESQGQSYEEYRADFRDLMVLRRFQGRVITPMVKITDKDVETYYLKKSGTTSDLVEISLRQIMINVEGDAAPEIVDAKRKLAGEVHKKLQDGMPFVDAVKIYSDDQAARESGGLMQGITLKDLSGQIKAEVESLATGEFSSPVRTALGFHIFYLEDKKFSGSQEFLDKKKSLEFELRNVELANQTKKWLEQQRQRAKIEELGDNS